MTEILTPAESEALLLSLRVSAVAVFAALPFAFAAALLLTIFGTRAGLGAWLLAHFGIRFVFSWTGAALASAIITFPFQVRAIRLALESADKGLNEAAETLGAGWWDRLVNVTLPLALPG